jgi:hypothetical protein
MSGFSEAPGTREWLDYNGLFLFGKHKHESYESVIAYDRGYVYWLVNNEESMCDEDRAVLQLALDR